MFRVFRSLKTLPFEAKGSVLALGNFDGMHVGHRALLRETTALARSLNAPAAIMSFYPHPRSVLTHAPALTLYPLKDKLQIVKEAGINLAFILHFSQNFLQLTAETFVEELLIKQMQVKAVITGEDFRFGMGRQGSPETLRAYEKAQQFRYLTVPDIMLEGTRVSSSAIRQALVEGNMPLAHQLLGGPYHLTGRVVQGKQLGRTLGVPTANITLADDLQLPKKGVYHITATLEHDATQYAGVANLGLRPTLHTNTPTLTLEVHLFDFDQTIYGRRMTVAFHHFLREEQRFSDLNALQEQLQKDITAAKLLSH